MMKGFFIMKVKLPENIYVPEGMKYCYHCGQVKPLDHFGKWSYGKDGRRTWCKECCNDYAKELKASKLHNHSEVSLSRKITKGAVDDIFDVRNLKDIPSNVKKQMHIPAKILIGGTPEKHKYEMRSNITNVLRRIGNKQVHLSQIVVAYYRMYGVFISNKSMSKWLTGIKKVDVNLSQPCKGYYKYNNSDLNEKGGVNYVRVV